MTARRCATAFGISLGVTALWITQQLREAFPYDTSCKYLVYDRDAKFGAQVGEAVAALAIQPCGLLSVAPGKTALPNDGSEAAARIYWTT